MKKAKKHLQNRSSATAGKRANVRSRSDKARRKRALEGMVRELGYDTRYVHITDTSHAGNRAHAGDKKHATGVFSAASGGYGFVHCEGEGRDVFIPAHLTAGAITGDTVSVSYTCFSDGRGERTEGRVERITAPVTTVIGTLIEHEEAHVRFGKYRHGFTLLPDDRRLHIRPILDGTGAARVGDKVEVQLDRARGIPLHGRVLRSFGPAEEKEANYLAILASAGIETAFTERELQAAELAARRPIDGEERVRLTSETVLTIDGADAKDLDDALSVRRTGDGGFVLGVHIADVAYYVEAGSILERMTQRRGNSLYFTDKVIPMLPPALSNGACSLNEGEDKAALSAHITLSSSGDILRTVLRKTVLTSKKRGVYSEVNDVLAHGERSSYYKEYRAVYRSLSTLSELYEVLKRRAEARGAITLEGREAVILLDESGHPRDIVCRERGVSEGIVEQCMLIANEAVATLLTERGIPCIYRIHEPPPTEKAEELLTYLRTLSLDVRGMHADRIRSQELVRVLGEAAERGVSYPVSQRMLRAMAKAAYDSRLHAHFGLGMPCYCHFTAPIRRVSDLGVHRIVREVLLGERPAAALRSYAERTARAATEGELRALGAERRIEQLYKALYMQDRIGELFEVTVSSVTKYGVYAETDATCEGFLPVEELVGSYVFDEAQAALHGRDGSIRIGDRLRVRLQSVELSQGTSYFTDASADTLTDEDTEEGSL